MKQVYFAKQFNPTRNTSARAEASFSCHAVIMILGIALAMSIFVASIISIISMISLLVLVYDKSIYFSDRRIIPIAA